MRSPSDVVDIWIEAFNRAHANALADLYAEGATNHKEGLIQLQRGYRDRLSFLRLNDLPIAD